MIKTVAVLLPPVFVSQSPCRLSDENIQHGNSNPMAKMMVQVMPRRMV